MIKYISQFKDFNSFMMKKYAKKIDFDVERHPKSKDEDDHLYLYRLKIEKEIRRKGLGSQFMRDICCYADCEKVPIELSATPLDDEIVQERLEKFYEKFGFQKIKKQDTMMRRLPKISPTKSIKAELI